MEDKINLFCLKDTFEKEIQHVFAILAEQDKRYQQRFDAAEKAAYETKIASEKRFDSVNEFRAVLADQQRLLMPRSEVEVIVRALTEKIDELSKKLAEEKGEGEGFKNGWAYVIAIIGLIATILAITGKI